MDELRKVQIHTDLEELSAKGHLTQREMKMAVEVLGDLLSCIEELEKELEELASRLSRHEDADAGTVGLALEPVKNIEVKDFDIPIEGDAEEDEEDG